MTDLIQRVEASILHRRLIPDSGKLLLAISGGLDSMVLLHVLRRISARHRWKYVVAHFNHRLRGRAGDADENFVRDTARRLRVPFVSDQADVKLFARRGKISIEMAGRKLRHEFFVRAARRRHCRAIALAHHIDDQVELFFVRLLRGGGAEGLAGMKWKSPSPADPNLFLVRPLLGFSREELRQFAAENKIRFREDKTNAGTDILRNRIRHELLPLLREKYQPGLTAAVLRTMEIVGAEAELVGDVAKTIPSGNQGAAPAFDHLPVALQRRILQARLTEAGVIADFELIETLRHAPDQFVSTGPAMAVARDGRGAIVLRDGWASCFGGRQRRVKLRGQAGEAVLDGTRIRWRRTISNAGVGGKPARRAGREVFDADQVGEEVIVRHWQAGDRFQPIGMKSAVKLQDLFINAKIPRARRHELLVATTAAGEIFWVEGLRMAERFKVGPGTRRRLAWDWAEAEGTV